MKIITMLKLIAFDLDGTVADTLADLACAVNFALSQQGLPTYKVDEYRTFVGNGVDRLMRDTMGPAYTPDGAERMKSDFQSYYASHCLDYTAPYDGISELLARLARDGYLTAVVSNKPDRFVPEILSALYPEHKFVYAWGQRQDIPRKPDPTALNRLIELCGVEKSQTLYVGDSNVDVSFAHNAGVPVCGVSWGFRGARELKEAGADHIVNTPAELYELISAINNADE